MCSIMQLACYFAVIYQKFTSDSEVQKFTRLKRAVKSESLKVGKSAVGKFATQNTLIPTFRTFHRQKYVGLKLPNNWCKTETKIGRIYGLNKKGLARRCTRADSRYTQRDSRYTHRDSWYTRGIRIASKLI